MSLDKLWPGCGGWSVRVVGNVTYHYATVAGGHDAGYVTRNDANELVAAVVDRRGVAHVIGAGYGSLHAAKCAVDHARMAAHD